jgi:DNA-binding YbaB/EbfC family protein
LIKPIWIFEIRVKDNFERIWSRDAGLLPKSYLARILKRTPMADFLGMMKQAAQLQSKMKALQDELEHIEVEGVAGGGLVTVRMTAKTEVKAVKIDPSLIKPDDREILEDLLVAAHNDARRKAESAMQEKMQTLTGGLSLPPGLGLT